MTFSLIIGIPTGIIAAVRVNQWWDSQRGRSQPDS